MYKGKMVEDRDWARDGALPLLLYCITEKWLDLEIHSTSECTYLHLHGIVRTTCSPSDSEVAFSRCSVMDVASVGWLKTDICASVCTYVRALYPTEVCVVYLLMEWLLGTYFRTTSAFRDVSFLFSLSYVTLHKLPCSLALMAHAL